MFSGIVQEVGSVNQIQPVEGGGIRLSVGCSQALSNCQLGDSIAVNGACLTVVENGSGYVVFDAVLETLRCTNLGALCVGSVVNLEPSLRVGESIHGHFVSGHIDCVAKVTSRQREGEGEIFSIELPEKIRILVAPKGSIAVSGVSLTVGEVNESTFKVYLIPHTLSVTTLGRIKPGDLVNLEADLLARYISNIVSKGAK